MSDQLQTSGLSTFCLTPNGSCLIEKGVDNVSC